MLGCCEQWCMESCIRTLIFFPSVPVRGIRCYQSSSWACSGFVPSVSRGWKTEFCHSIAPLLTHHHQIYAFTASTQSAMKGVYCLAQAPRLNSYLVPRAARKLHCFQINSNTTLVKDLKLLREWSHPKIKNKKIKKILHLYIAKTGKSSFLT